MASGSAVASCKRLEGKVAIITGGASGIGASAVKIFHENGAKVVIADVQDNLGQELANKLGDGVCYIHCNVSNEDDIINLVDSVVAKHGKLDIMYNNAGIMDRRFASILDTPKADLERVLAVNTVGSFLGAKHAAKVMVNQRKGCILFTASACTGIGGLSTPAYGISKHGILGLVKTLAAELEQYGIRVNCVSPYAVMTGMTVAKGLHPTVVEAIVSEIGNLKGEVLRSDGIANAALYLASDDHVSGMNLLVDGGFSAVNPSLMRAFNIGGVLTTFFNALAYILFLPLRDMYAYFLN